MRLQDSALLKSRPQAPARPSASRTGRTSSSPTAVTEDGALEDEVLDASGAALEPSTNATSSAIGLLALLPRFGLSDAVNSTPCLCV